MVTKIDIGIAEKRAKVNTVPNQVITTLIKVNTVLFKGSIPWPQLSLYKASQSLSLPLRAK